MASPNLLGTLWTGNAVGMGIGAGIFLMVVGAIMTFALDVGIAGVNLDGSTARIDRRAPHWIGLALLDQADRVRLDALT